MNNPIIIGVDIGLSGGLALDDDAILMPVVTNTVKPAVMIQALLNGKKQYYKSGPNQGEVKMKVKTPAKTENQLDLKTILSYFRVAGTIVFESPGISMGNAARSTATTNRNFGKLLACAEIAKCKIVTVTPAKWKKDLGITKDKLECVNLAEKLSGLSFKTERGALIDGPAEAWLIRHWYINYGSK